MIKFDRTPGTKVYFFHWAATLAKKNQNDLKKAKMATLDWSILIHRKAYSSLC